jgi:hypothetical protein
MKNFVWKRRKLWRSKNYAKQKTVEEIKKQTEIE